MYLVHALSVKVYTFSIDNAMPLNSYVSLMVFVGSRKDHLQTLENCASKCPIPYHQCPVVVLIHDNSYKVIFNDVPCTEDIKYRMCGTFGGH